MDDKEEKKLEKAFEINRKNFDILIQALFTQQQEIEKIIHNTLNLIIVANVSIFLFLYTQKLFTCFSLLFLGISFIFACSGIFISLNSFLYSKARNRFFPSLKLSQEDEITYILILARSLEETQKAFKKNAEILEGRQLRIKKAKKCIYVSLATLLIALVYIAYSLLIMYYM